MQNLCLILHVISLVFQKLKFFYGYFILEFILYDLN